MTWTVQPESGTGPHESKSESGAGTEPEAHETGSEFREAAHESKSESGAEAGPGPHETESEFREAAHESRSESGAGAEPEAHETKSEFQGAAHESRSESGADFDEKRRAAPALPDVEELARALLEGLRLAAGAR